MPSECFDILNRFKGFGDPSGRLWFIGIEEAFCWHADPDMDEAAYRRYMRGSFPIAAGEIERDAARYGRKYTRVYDIMSKLAVAILLQETSLVGWREYRNTRLLVEGGDTFQANLYPLGKKSLSAWPPHYATLFNLPTREAYLGEVRRVRFPMLREMHASHAPLLTVCFGKAAWEDFKQLFALGHNNDQGEGCCFYPCGIALCPFFSPRFISDESILRISRILREKVRDV